ncbi:Evolutionarily conserved signaling intermediate in Toll pathway [Echinococcus granulosus]|uniref:Evolutionarily conserved signaling intermediate in Toll pathway n=1 Tax=Echinococcus granulosus TaxID=6210 RepID=W6ULE1_ECHGR|nr:Evolutionarily conserved signaling intermediate in Toll pathway [Echinococcus granulosus]EUB62335.1 Evolutionarily conserved signaling intermediate in Toll pathway [Echinococcus granulosus]
MGLKRSQLKQLKKAAFLDAVELYKAHSGSARRGFNEFILAAMQEMRAYEVEDDLEAYKALLSVLPREGRLKAKSILHADVGGYKQQQDTVVRLLLQLNANREVHF